jgi:formylglycine-generating enzyme required for sulfatase activity
MRRSTASVLIVLIAGFGALAACFPSFAVGGSDGGGGNGDDGGTKQDATAGGGSDDSGVIIVVLPDGAKVQQDGAPIPPGTDAGPNPSADGGAYVPPTGTAPFTFLFGPDSEQTSTNATLSHGFLMDVTEVTVAGFTNWVNVGRPLPNDGQSLDPGGPYASQMYWQQAWNTQADAVDYKTSTGTCTTAQDPYSLGNTVTLLGPTYDSTPAAPNVPINCVNWYQAAAYCFYVGKRLPTQVEWEYEAVGRSHGYTYPWGDSPTPTDCSLAIWIGDGGLGGNNGCGFPVPVGSAPAGRSLDGVLDLEGSLEEWIWDAFSFSNNTPWPPDYAGTPEDAGTQSGGRDIRGGSWISPAASLQGDLPANNDESTVQTNLGFRCVKTVLP